MTANHLRNRMGNRFVKATSNKWQAQMNNGLIINGICYPGRIDVPLPPQKAGNPEKNRQEVFDWDWIPLSQR